MSKTVIKIENAFLKDNDTLLLKDISLSIKEGEFWTIIGNSGSGKTLLGKLITGILAPKSGKYINTIDAKKRIFVPQQYNFGHLTTARVSYFSKRYETTETNLYPSVLGILTKVSGSEDKVKEVAEELQIDHILNSRLIQLSNGECKKVQLAISILSNPELLVLDNPFIGLDNISRKKFHEILYRLASKNIQIIVITTPAEIPTATTHIVELENRTIKSILKASDIDSKLLSDKKTNSKFSLNTFKLNHLSEKLDKSFEVAVQMKNVNIAHGEKTILKNISWEIKHGEKWALLGKNGAGKSTLLSLITADHPQAYINNITLFDKKRGSGESIWQIKKRIGFISPEFHLYFLPRTYLLGINQPSENYSINNASRKGMSCFDTIASGIHDQIGFTQKLTHVENQEVEFLLDFLGLRHLSQIPFQYASLGEQRLILLARTLIKVPDLLVLDEPCQGLDEEQTHRFNKTIDSLTTELNLTLIYVSHYHEDIPNCISQKLFLQNGEIVDSIF